MNKSKLNQINNNNKKKNCIPAHLNQINNSNRNNNNNHQLKYNLDNKFRQIVSKINRKLHLKKNKINLRVK